MPAPTPTPILEWAGRALLTTVLLLPAAAVAALLAAAFTLFNLGYALVRQGLLHFLFAILNAPFDLLVGTLAWLGALGFSPLYAGTAHAPAAGWIAGSLVFRGGPIGHLVSTFANGFTPTSTIFISGRAWRELDDDGRDRLINHELWHARHQFSRYTGWLFWPAYLVSNLFMGTHEKNPFESGRRGPYTMVDTRWASGYRQSGDYVQASNPFWT